MPTISKIRFTNVVYDGGNKRYADEIFHFYGENGAIVLENGGGKTVFIQTALQAILPHTSLANRKVKDTYTFDDGPAHIAIEWIKNDRPRIYALTAITIFPHQNSIDSYRYVYEYGPNDENSIEKLPFTRPLSTDSSNKQKRIASHIEMKEYYNEMSQKTHAANTFSTISAFTEYIEKNFQIIADEWKSISIINSAEGDVEKFFEACATEKALYEKLLIPTVEQSIAAFEQHKFVDIFEQQRDKFKILKQLNAQLKEYDVIQKELSNYVNVVFTLHEQKKRYEIEKQKGKAYYQLLTKYKNEIEDKLNQLLEQEQKLENDFHHFTMKQKSYEIAVMEEELQKLIAIYNDLEEEVLSIQEKLNNEEQYLGNLKYAKEKKLLKIAEEKLDQYKKQLKQLDEQSSTEELLEQLDEVKAKLHGNFLTEQQRYEKQKKEVEQEKRQEEERLEEQQKIIEQHISEQQEINNKMIGLEKEIELKEIQFENIAKDLFENEVQRQQPILEHKTNWTQQSQHLDEEIVQLKNEEKKILLKKEENEKRLENIQEEFLTLNVKETEVKQHIKQMEENEQKLRIELMNVLPKISEKTSLYIKEASILQDLTHLLNKKESYYDNKLYEERIAFRHVDDYGQQQSFFADPYIAKRLPVWRQRFSYLETAIEYAMGDTELQVEQELLAITLITTEEEKEKLEQLVIDSAKYLIYPIQIWTLPEVIAISQGKQKPKINLLQPELWQKLIDLETFQQWKQEAQIEAEKTKTERESADEERTYVKGILLKLNSFYQQHPYTTYQQLKEQLNQLERKIHEVNREQKLLSTEIKDADLLVRKLQKDVSNKSELKKYYDEKIEKLIQYEKLQNEVQRLKQELFIEKEKYEKRSKQLEKDKKEEQQLKEELNNLINRIHALDIEHKELIAGRYLYKEVTTYSPKFTDESYEVLAQDYHHIEQRLNKISSNRKEKEQLIHQQQEVLNQHKNSLKQLRVEYSKLDEQFELPIDYEQQIEKLPASIKNLKEQFSNKTNQCNEAKGQKDEKKGALQLKRQELENPITFEQPLSTVKYQLEEQFKRLKLREKQLKKTKNEYLTIQNETDNILRKMELLNATHLFLAPSVKAFSLTVDEETEFSYRKEHFIDALKKNLENCKGLITRHSEIVLDSKEQFLQFCNQNISEVRLRNTIIDGVKGKDNYEDLVKHQQEMENTIHMSRQYAEKDIKKHDEQLVEFVNRVHKHLRKVVEELKHIPRKTKVNVDGEDVNIYRFNIPEWTDEEGLVQIRARIDWIIEQLDQIESRTVDEQESKQKSRKQLEEWLSTVQLLRYITQNKEWRVSCRKVMNDNRISKTYETWSRSNAWSGGEKWSKNMALFLGVLNYVAEKRQYISSKKKSRTVILDNPFGKASSDHVLSPVFFIAKQLGFQIIALTAHVEGKFLHDYFPIVYSLRLRNAVGTDKLIMETKKSMHQAFFRDYNEEAGEVIHIEQLSLFSE